MTTETPWHHGQTFTDGDVTWDVGTLWNLVASQAPVEFPVAALPAFDARVWVDRWKNVTPEWIIRHAQRIQQADLSCPILLTPDGEIADGWHRLAKARLEGRETLPALRLPEDYRNYGRAK